MTMIYPPEISRFMTRKAIIKQIADYYIKASFSGYREMDHYEKEKARDDFSKTHGVGKLYTVEEARIQLEKKLSRVSPGMLKRLNQKLASGDCTLIWHQIKCIPEECAVLAESMATSIAFGYFRDYCEMKPDERVDVLMSVERVYNMHIEMPPDLTDDPRDVAEDQLIRMLFEMEHTDLIRINEIFKTGENCMYIRSKKSLETHEPQAGMEKEKAVTEQPQKVSPRIPKSPERKGPVFIDATATRNGFLPETPRKRKSGFDLVQWEMDKDEREDDRWEHKGYTPEEKEDE